MTNAEKFTEVFGREIDLETWVIRLLVENQGAQIEMKIMIYPMTDEEFVKHGKLKED